MKLILGFSIPLLFGNLFQQFYSMVDTMIVGRVLGTGPLAAVGSTGSITFLIIGFCLGLCSGFAIPVAQRFGSRDYKELRRFIGNAVWLCVGFGFVLTVLTVIFCRNILEFMDTPADIMIGNISYPQRKGHVVIYIHIGDQSEILEHHAQGSPEFRNLSALKAPQVKPVDHHLS